MPPGVFALVLFVAVLHVLWNSLLKTSGDTLRTASRAMIVGVVVFAPAVGVAWWLSGRSGMPIEVLGLAVVSGLLEAAYFVCLSAAYQRGDLSVVYPIARGTAPILSVTLGVVVLGERLAVPGAIGVSALLAGILLVQRPWRALAAVRDRAEFRRSEALEPSWAPSDDGNGTGGPSATAVAAGRQDGRPSVQRTSRVSGPGAAEFALLTGVMIAAYSAVDRVAVQRVQPWLYAGVVFPICAIALVAWVHFVADPRADRDAARSPSDPPLRSPASWTRAGVAGVISLGAYALILLAYTLAPLTAVAPLRESSVVLASAWGAIRMHEAVDRADRARRIGGACLVLGGAVLLALGS